MKLLINKALKMTAHPTAYIFLAFVFFFLIPNYPYEVTYFYMTLAIFFTMISARENNDVSYMMNLPIEKKIIVKEKFVFAVMFEALSLLLSIPFIAIRQFLMNGEANQAGLDANMALLGSGLIIFGLFNAIFFPLYYKNINKIGVPFIFSSVATFSYLILSIIFCYTWSLFQNKIDTPDFNFAFEKSMYILLGLIVYLICTYFSYNLSTKRFEKIDL